MQIGHSYRVKYRKYTLIGYICLITSMYTRGPKCMDVPSIFVDANIRFPKIRSLDRGLADLKSGQRFVYVLL